MKITDFAILFVIITLPFNILLGIKTANLNNGLYKSLEMNRIIDTAVEDGVSQLVTVGGDKEITLNKERAMEAFFNSLFLNMDVVGDEIAQKKILGYIPAMVIVDYDGIYLLTNQEYTAADGYKEIKPIWKPKVPYSYSDGSYIYSFSLDDYIEIYDIANNRILKGLQGDLKAEIPSDIIQQDELFENVRRRTIIEAIKREVNHSINNHNLIAHQFGITYSFTLPVIDDEDWHKTLDDVGMLVFFQGLPIGIGGQRYNNYALGGARVVKGQHYYQQVNPNGITYYHKEGCPFLLTKEELVDSRREAARGGAFPCRECWP
ncbi:hypothetical protein [Alkaliphilus serpentinus]|uniref:Uncharacterized protein n=1 Tax=Alkaliphilus serpentinus TaxID=1482731 RepID=A0A833HL82_9FIRM|nr:hypothetical protein [Alkaliphilus serpentinus]KAB3525461.1 hypothetical protein F8153_15360 [Alkaliphilus serpentinus]